MQGTFGGRRAAVALVGCSLSECGRLGGRCGGTITSLFFTLFARAVSAWQLTSSDPENPLEIEIPKETIKLIESTVDCLRAKGSARRPHLAALFGI